MKFKKYFPFVFAFLPFIITFIGLIELPPEIPVHYNADGNVTRIGSKYELLILPVISIAFQLFWVLIKFAVSDNPKSGKATEKILFYGNIIVTITFTIISAWFVVLSY